MQQKSSGGSLQNAELKEAVVVVVELGGVIVSKKPSSSSIVMVLSADHISLFQGKRKSLTGWAIYLESRKLE